MTLTQEQRDMADKLTEAQRATFSTLHSDWQAGPELPMLDHLGTLREAGLIEREFGDMSKPKHFADDHSLTIHLSACWWFRLTPLGDAVRQYLLSGAPS